MRHKKYINKFNSERIECDIEGASIWYNISYRNIDYDSFMFEWPCLQFPDQLHSIIVGGPRDNRKLTFNLG